MNFFNRQIKKNFLSYNPRNCISYVPIFSAVNNFPWRKIETQGGNCSRIDIFLIDRVSKCHLADLVVQLDKWEWVLTSWLRRIEVNDKSSVRGLINVWERDNHRDRRGR